MKRLLFALLALCAYASATTTVIGTVQTLAGGNVTSGTFVRFWLRGCGGNQPRVNGVGLIAPTQGGSFYFDFPVNGSGAVAGTIYSTRDSTGSLGGDIECGGNKTSEWYGLQAFTNGKGGPEVAVHAKNGAVLDITNVTPITTNPVVTAPTGDTTYCRLDGGSGLCPAAAVSSLTGPGSITGLFSGNPTFSGNPVFSGIPNFTYLQTVNGGSVELGQSASDMQITGTTGTNGQRIQISPISQTVSTLSSQLQLVPGANCNHAVQICSQLIMFNTTNGVDIEKFEMSAEQDQFVFATSNFGAGVLRGMTMRVGGTDRFGITAANSIIFAPNASTIGTFNATGLRLGDNNNPTAMLDVIGNGKVSGTFAIGGAATAAGNKVGTTLNATNGIYQSVRSVAGCTTPAIAGNLCVTPTTVTWGATFADAAYSAGCNPSGAPANQPSSIFIVTKSAGSMTVNYYAITGAAASWSSIDCWAIHD